MHPITGQPTARSAGNWFTADASRRWAWLVAGWLRGPDRWVGEESPEGWMPSPELMAAVAARIRESYDAALGDGRRPLIFALDAHRALYGQRRVESLGDSPEAMAHSLFAVLRDADALGADALFSEAVEADGVGLAVMNRLGRAAAFHIVEV